MPWLIDGEIDDVSRDIPLETVVYKDADAYKITPQKRYPDVQPYDLLMFKCCQFDWGRRFSYATRRDAVLPFKLGNNIVCDRFKCLLEQLEPDKHIFTRVDIRAIDRETAWPEPYWYWLCRNYVDAIVPDIGDGDPRRSRGLYWGAREGCFLKYRPRQNPSFSPIIGQPDPGARHYVPVLSCEAIIGAHAWVDNGFRTRDASRYRFMSDHLVDQMKSIGIQNGFGLRWIEKSVLPATRLGKEACDI